MSPLLPLSDTRGSSGVEEVTPHKVSLGLLLLNYAGSVSDAEIFSHAEVSFIFNSW